MLGLGFGVRRWIRSAVAAVLKADNRNARADNAKGRADQR